MLRSTQPIGLAQRGVGGAQGEQPLHTGEQRAVGPRPVQPGRLVVLAVGVVVAALAVAEFVAGEQHRRALGEQQAGEQGALQAGAQGEHDGVVGRAFDAAVPRVVVRMAVAVVLAVGRVVAVVVAHQVAQAEAVVRAQEVDAGRGGAAVVVELGRRAREAVGERPAVAPAAQPPRAHRVAEAVVPLHPAGREPAQPVAVGAEVPGLGDPFQAGEQRVGADGGKQRRAGIEVAAAVAPGSDREVEAEAVHAVARGPVAQRAHDQLDHARLAQVHRVAATAPVAVARGVLRVEVVGARVGQPAQR